MAKGTGYGLCPIMSNGSNVAVPCKGEKCHFWDEDRCSQKPVSYLIYITDIMIEIREQLTAIAGALQVMVDQNNRKD